MSLVKVKGVSNEVFIPDQIADEDKTFLVERTENIVGIVTRAKVEIGLELLKVEQRFREKKEFGGPNGWYQRWTLSLGIDKSMRSALTAAASLSLSYQGKESVINNMSAALLSALTPPGLITPQKSRITSGSSNALAQVVLEKVEGGEQVTEKDLRQAAASTANEILALEQLVDTKQKELSGAQEAWQDRPSKKEDPRLYAHLRSRINVTEKSLSVAESRLESLAAEKAALEAKYEDWRSPEAIKQEFEEAIAKARAEEQAKKVAAKAPEIDEEAIQKAALKVANQTAELKIKAAQEAAERAQKEAVATALADYKAEQQKLKEAEEKAAREAATKKADAEKKAREKAVKDALDAYKSGELAKLNADPDAIKHGKIMLGADIHSFKRAAERLFHFRCLPDDTLPSVFQLELEAVEAMGQWFESLSDENLVVVQQLLNATVSGRKVSTSINSIHDNLVTIDV